MFELSIHVISGFRYLCVKVLFLRKIRLFIERDSLTINKHQLEDMLLQNVANYTELKFANFKTK